jgi:hypothetical protein
VRKDRSSRQRLRNRKLARKELRNRKLAHKELRNRKLARNRRLARSSCGCACGTNGEEDHASSIRIRRHIRMLARNRKLARRVLRNRK